MYYILLTAHTPLRISTPKLIWIDKNCIMCREKKIVDDNDEL